jgi:hypothetical protein
MNISQAIETLLENDQPVPKPLPIPTEEEVSYFEKQLEFTFPVEYRQFQLRAGNVTVGTLEPAVCIKNIDAYLNPTEIANDGWEMGVPRDFLPFCCDNGCYYCISKDGTVKFWDNEDCQFGYESWTFSSWVNEVWLETQ